MKDQQQKAYEDANKENVLLNDTVNFRLNKYEKILIKQQAQKLKMKPSTFIRFAFLNLIKTWHNEN